MPPSSDMTLSELPPELDPPPMPSKICLNTDFEALASARFDSFSANDFSTSSNCLPPETASLKALLIALANCAALTPSALVLLRVFSVTSGNSLMAGSTRGSVLKLSDIGISLSQFVEARAVERRFAPAHRLDRAGQFARRHPPERVRRQLQ